MNMKNYPIISIIIPIYNGEKYLKRCLESVLVQSYPNLEIICVNDGSTDMSLDILKMYEFKYGTKIKIINKKNGGLSDARNVGIKNSGGEFLLFLDCDDWIEKNTIMDLYKLMLQKKVDVIRYNYILDYGNKTGNKGSIKSFQNTVFKKDKIKEKVIPAMLLGELQNYVWLLFIRKSCIGVNQMFDVKYKFMEDVIFCLKLLLNINSIYFVDSTFYHYFYNDSGLTYGNDKIVKNIKNLIMIKHDLKTILKKEMLLTIDLEKRINSVYCNMILYYLFKLYDYTSDIIKIKRICNINNLKKEMVFFNSHLISLHYKLMIYSIQNNWWKLLQLIYILKQKYCYFKKFVGDKNE